MRELARSSEERVGLRRRSGRGPHFALERREHPRLPAVDYRVWVGGWITELDFVTIAARVENLSEGGALVVSPIAFPEDEDVWLRLGDPRRLECVRGLVLEAAPSAEGGYRTRLRFYDLCPDEFYQAVTRGLSFGGPLPVALP